MSASAADLKELIRDIPDFPKEGILFRDLTPLLKSPEGLRAAVLALSEPFRALEIEAVLGIESRGFVLGAPVALELGVGFVPVRKPGKLPHETLSARYELEYGSDTLEIHVDAVRPGERVLIVDDLIATGGTASATVELARKAGAEVVACSFLVELLALAGRDGVSVDNVHSVLTY